MEPAQAQMRRKAFAMSMDKDALTGTNLALCLPSIASPDVKQILRNRLGSVVPFRHCQVIEGAVT
jgi:hypothetical protein